MPSLNRNEKKTCEDCDKEYRRFDGARHSKNCVRGVISRSECRYFTYNQQETNYHVAKNMLQQLSSNQRLARFAKKSFRVSTRSNNNGEKNMGRNNESQVIRWQTWTRLCRRKRKMERNSKMSWVLVSISWWTLRWRMGVIRYLTFKCQS